MIYYPITGILRTPNGLLPIYNIVPDEPGTYRLRNPIIVNHKNSSLVIKEIEVIGKTIGVCMCSTYGYYAYYTDNNKLPYKFSILKGFNLKHNAIMGLTNKSIYEYAIKAVLASCSFGMSPTKLINKIYNKMPELIPFLQKDVAVTYNLITTNFLDFSEDNYLLFAYLYFKIIFELELFKSKAAFYEIKVKNNCWREIIHMVLNSYNVEQYLKMRKDQGRLLYWVIKKESLRDFIMLVIESLNLDPMTKFAFLIELSRLKSVTLKGSKFISISKLKAKTKRVTIKPIPQKIKYDCKTVWVAFKDYPNKWMEINGIIPSFSSP